MCQMGNWFYLCGHVRFPSGYLAVRCPNSPDVFTSCASPIYMKIHDRTNSIPCEKCEQKEIEKQWEKWRRDNIKRDHAERKSNKRDEERKRTTRAKR